MTSNERFSIPRQGLSGEILSSEESEPQRYFKINNLDSGLFGYGFIPPFALDALVGERFRIAGVSTDFGKPELIRIEADEIAQVLGTDGTDPDYSPANWWDGYASAFKNPRGEVGGHRGQIRIPISSGEIQEAEDQAEI